MQKNLTRSSRGVAVSSAWSSTRWLNSSQLNSRLRKWDGPKVVIAVTINRGRKITVTTARMTSYKCVTNRPGRADSSKSVVQDDGRRKGPGPEALEAGVFAPRSLEECYNSAFS